MLISIDGLCDIGTHSCRFNLRGYCSVEEEATFTKSGRFAGSCLGTQRELSCVDDFSDLSYTPSSSIPLSHELAPLPLDLTPSMSMTVTTPNTLVSSYRYFECPRCGHSHHKFSVDAFSRTARDALRGSGRRHSIDRRQTHALSCMTRQIPLWLFSGPIRVFAVSPPLSLGPIRSGIRDS